LSGKIGRQKKDNDHSQPTRKQTLVIDRSSLEDKQLPQLGDSKNRIVNESQAFPSHFEVLFLYLRLHIFRFLFSNSKKVEEDD
jgi:hypothetical protein